MESRWIPTNHPPNAINGSVEPIDIENGDFGTPPDERALSLCKPAPFPTQSCQETISLIETLLMQAKSGELIGVALVGLYRGGKYRLDLTGDAKFEGNTMSVAGMLAKLQSMALDLY